MQRKTTSFWLVMLALLRFCPAGLTGQAPHVSVDPEMLKAGGDYFDNEILACNRLRAERHVLLRGDESAPSIAKDASGAIYVVTHSGNLLTSADGGRTFGGTEAISISGSPATDVQALGSTRGGALLIVYGRQGKLYVANSSDKGKTWREISAVKDKGFAAMESEGGVNLVELRDGTILLPAVRRKANGNAESEEVLFASKDAGKTWKIIGSFGERFIGANLLELRSGDLLASLVLWGARNSGDPAPEINRKELFNNVVIARSRDRGKTWADYQCVTRYNEAPASLTQLRDGAVVLSYGEQNFPYGARAIVSDDDGHTWRNKVYILGYSTVRAEWYAGAMFTAGPGWQVSSIALDNGILTLYTRGRLELTGKSGMTDWYKKSHSVGEKGRSILAVQWTLEEMSKPPVSFPGIIGKLNAEGYLDNAHCLIKPEHLAEGGDYFDKDEILVYERVLAEHYTVGPGSDPIVALDPQGNPVIAGTEGALYQSRDGGRSWERFGAVKDAKAIQTFGILNTGTMLVGNNITPDNWHTYSTEVLRSSDGGRIWQKTTQLDPGPPFDNVGGGNCFRINQMPDGTVLMTSGNLDSPRLGAQIPSFGDSLDFDGIWRSRDDGKTWGDFSYLGARSCETNLLHLKSGKILAAIRYQGPRLTDDFVLLDPTGYRAELVKNVAIASSNDGGYTWSEPKTVTRWFECPGDLVEMNDGTIVLSYQQKNAPSGLRAMVSLDQGNRWPSQMYVLAWWPISSGHSSSVLLKDGKILTVGNGNGKIQCTLWKPLRGTSNP